MQIKGAAQRNARDKRSPPLRDDKILTGWNALMIRTMADAAVILKAPRYSEAAARAAEHLWQAHFKAPGELRRFSFEGKTSLLATQPDHAFLAVAFTALYDATGEPKWLERAEQLTKRMHALFLDEAAGDYIMAKSDASIPDAKIRTDQPVPSGNAVALELYSKLARRTMSNEYRQRAHTVLAAVSGVAAGSPASSGYVLKSADEFLRGELGTVQFLALGRVRIALTRMDNTRARLDIEIAPGWHINAHKPLEDHFIPTVVSLQGPGKPEPTDVAYPKALVRKLGFAENKMALYEGKITIPVTLPKRDDPIRAVQFAAQACSDKVCLAPETLRLTLTPMPTN